MSRREFQIYQGLVSIDIEKMIDTDGLFYCLMPFYALLLMHGMVRVDGQ
jgi:hypothetical protein